jgi:hypothetical protein
MVYITFYHSVQVYVQSLLSSLLLSKTVKIKTYRTINVPVVSDVCETSLHTLRHEHRLGCEISGSQGGVYEVQSLLGCTAV